MKQTDVQKIYYLGVCISVPNGYVLYLRKPREKPKSGGKIAQVQFLLFAATSQMNPYPQDHLLYFNAAEEKWEKLKSIEVEVLYYEAGDVYTESYPIYDPFEYGDVESEGNDSNLKRVGFSKVAVANAEVTNDAIGLLYQEEGLGKEAFIPNAGYPDFPIIDKLARKHIPRAVGGGTGPPPKPPIGGD